MGNGIMRKLFYLMFLVVLAGNVSGHTWDDGDPADHLWSSPFNWVENTVPNFSVSAIIGDATVCTTTCEIDASMTGASRADCKAVYGPGCYTCPGTATLNIKGELSTNGGVFYMGHTGGTTGIMNVSGNGTVNCGVFNVGSVNTSNGTLNMTGGTVNATYLRVGCLAGATGLVTIDAGSINTTVGELAVGYSGTGTVSMTGGTVTTAGNCWVGGLNGSNGTLTMDGGTIIAPELYVGLNPGSTGQATIDDGSITTTGLFCVGNSGQGSMTMSGGSITGGANFYLGRTGTGPGSLDMSGGSITATDMLTGVAAGSNGSMEMSGGTVNAGQISFGWAGTGSLTMTGGAMTADGNFIVASPDYGTSAGDVNLVGGTITACDLIIGTAGLMDIEAGTLILAGDDRVTVNGYINDGLLTGYGESKNVHVYYDGSDTIVTAGADLASYACAPSPYDGEIVPAWNFNDVNLIWAPGDSAAKHRIYFGQTFDEVNDANTSTAGIYKGEQNLDANEFDPGTLELDQSYYWRIDEVNGVDEWKGGIWMFTVQAAYTGSTKPLPRIKARTHSPYPEFYNSVTDAKFVPEGNAYVRLYEASDDNKYHATFINGLYDANDAEAALEDMADSGYNIVYVFIQGGGTVLNAEGKYGTGGDDINYNEPNLYIPNMDNFMDFLEKANENEIYVMPVLMMWPYNQYYRSRASRPEDDPNLEHKNRWYLADGAQEAKEIYCEYFIKYIKDTNPALLSTVFAYIVEAEICCLSDYKPFSMSSGTVTTADGNSYDMAVKSERQACQDNNTNLWANRCVDAIHKVDPAAMVTASVFTFSAVHHDGPDGLWPPNPNPNYPRWPARPLKLVSTRLSFIDIHIYPGWSSMTTLLNSSEWGSIDKTVKPFLMGEFGAYTGIYATPAVAAPVLSDWRVEAYNKGFTCSLLWTWDSNSIELAHWNAKDNPVINNALSPDLRPDHWEFNTDDDFEGWTLTHDITGGSVSGGRLSFDLSGPDPYMHSPDNLDLPSTQYDYFVLKMKNPTSDDSAVLYWIRDDDLTWNETKSKTISIKPNDTELTEYLFYLGDHDEWKDKGTIRRVRLDPVHYLGTWDEEPNHFEIDYMRLSGTPAIDSLQLIADNWLCTGLAIYGDINQDGIVNFVDFALLCSCD